MATREAQVGRAARMTGLKKPRPLRRFTETRNQNLQGTDEMENKLHNLNLAEPHPSVNDNEREPVPQIEENNNSTSSFTAIMDVGGEKLVLASTNMKTILKAASVLSLHMDGEILHLDGDSTGPNLPECGGDQRTVRAPSSPKSSRTIPPPTREQMKPFMKELPHLGRRATESHHFLEDSCPQRGSIDTSYPSSMAANKCYQYSVKDLLMMAKYPHSKIKPRNWRLIRDAFPELVSNEERYFEPFDLKACSPHALSHSKGHSEHEARNHSAVYPPFNVRKSDGIFANE